MVVMAYKVLLDQLVHLEEMVPMVKMVVKETKENLDHKDLQEQEMEVWSLLDGDEPHVLQPMIQNYSTKENLLGVPGIKLEVEQITFVYLINLSFYPIHLVYPITSPISMEQSMKLTITMVLFLHSIITMYPVLYVMFPLEYHI